MGLEPTTTKPAEAGTTSARSEVGGTVSAAPAARAERELRSWIPRVIIDKGTWRDSARGAAGAVAVGLGYAAALQLPPWRFWLLLIAFVLVGYAAGGIDFLKRQAKKPEAGDDCPEDHDRQRAHSQPHDAQASDKDRSGRHVREEEEERHDERRGAEGLRVQENAQAHLVSPTDESGPGGRQAIGPVSSPHVVFDDATRVDSVEVNLLVA